MNRQGPDQTNHSTLARPADQAGVPLSTARQIIQELHKRFGQKRDVPNQRSTERLPWVTDLTLVIEDPHGRPRTLEVTTHDISEGGFSFVYRQFVHPGTRILMHFGSVPGRPSLEGVVRNCDYVGHMHHRIGVQFSHADEIEQKPEDGEAAAPTGSG